MSRSPERVHWSEKVTGSLGSTYSIFLHTIIFMCFVAAPFLGFDLEKSLLILTTLVSLEAIYLALFIQMSLNRTNLALEHVEEVQEEISKEVEDIGEDIENMEKDIDEIQEDVEEINEEIEEIGEEVEDIGEEVEEMQKK